ncbi:MAG: hypothetical protein AAF533_18350 [Acidobacteriota bacterium]
MLRPARSLVLAVLALGATSSFGQVELLADVELAPRAGVWGWSPLLDVGSRAVFLRDSPGTGVEPWAFSEAEGAVLLADLAPGECSSRAFTTHWSGFETARLPEGVVFSADDGSGLQPWFTDGTPTGTRRLADLGFQQPAWHAALGDRAYFATRTELWQTDGTPGGTAVVASVFNASFLTPMGGLLYFAVSDEFELWVSDGTPGGTAPVTDLRLGLRASPSELVVADDRIYFTADETVSGRELWVTNGTALGTRRVTDLQPGPASSRILPLQARGSSLFFTAESVPDRAELWLTDGTGRATERLAIVDAEREPVLLDGRLVFAGDEGGAGSELWVSDGTAAGTQQLVDIRPGAVGSRPMQLTIFDGRAWFTADDGVNGRELWATDGTAVGTTLVLDVSPGGDGRVSHLGVVDGRLYFSADDGVEGHQLWSTDGLPGGTRRETDGERTGHSFPEDFTALADDVLFLAERGVVGELWSTDGTEAGTVLVRGATAEEPGGFGRSRELTRVGEHVFFVDTATDERLWRSDGTAAGTEQVISADRLESLFAGTSATGEELLYFVGTEDDSRRLWRSDGTASGTFSLVDDPTIEDWHARRPVSLNGRFYFGASPDFLSTELWSTDGTVLGTRRVADIAPFSGSSDPIELTVLDDTLFFTAWDALGGELWRSDGTEAGTTRVADINPLGDAAPGWVTAHDGALLFAADDGSSGQELWWSDGSDGSARRIVDLWPGPEGSWPEMLTAVGPSLFFVADDPDAGRELRRLDATSGLVELVADLTPGAASTGFDDLVVFGSRLLFVAGDGSDLRLYETDGTTAGTRAVEGLPDAACSFVDELSVVGERVYLRVTDTEHGREPWTDTARHELRTNGLVDDIATATSRLREPDVLGSPVENLTACGRTRLTAETSQRVTRDELLAGVPLPPSAGVLTLVELAGWCTCSVHPEERAPTGAETPREPIVVRLVDGEPVVTLLTAEPLSCP